MVNNKILDTYGKLYYTMFPKLASDFRENYFHDIDVICQRHIISLM